MKPIVITGGPGAGKTTLLAALAEYGYATFSEGSRTLIEQQSQLPDGILPWTDLPKFARLCLRFMGDQKLTAQQSPVAFMDRAIPDIVGYLKVGGCEIGQEFLDQSVGYYSQVFVCQPEASIYVQDEFRPHSFEEALQIHQVLVETYIELGYQVIEVPWGTVVERVAFVRQLVDSDTGAESKTSS
ncbi:AAA family ATPase [Vibrio europaeus]|uniref:ATPase n=1 Tax=Vibrio europaeus TaxID=300876 RepID=A0A178JAJ0_9VIBR|nr:AAA family ATPase [Vibrio europaeus]MDC5703184.1 AAA family ATPase [Vibrio europaeus]MDC5708584.1 AAA family ATPase [Vibrio europaeus]MDC5713076.1 AAA family ATPase [Vibrio europaeus]MDC5718089.1 AAA family ATPase [Vibrio europaeus]MDC5725496.1 AAA family ATPase [Vibrio europaeus]